jgi:hypothetical protein
MTDFNSYSYISLYARLHFPLTVTNKEDRKRDDLCQREPYSYALAFAPISVLQ